MSAGVTRGYEPGRRFNGDYRAILCHGGDSVIGGTPNCYARVFGSCVSFKSEEVHVEGVSTLAFVCNGKDGVDFGRSPNGGGQSENDERRKNAAENKRSDKNPGCETIPQVKKKEKEKQEENERNCSACENDYWYRRERDVRIVVFLVFMLIIHVATAIWGYFAHVWPDAFFQNNLKGFCSLLAAWLLSFLLWILSMNLFVELDLLPRLRKPLFEWMMVAVWLWPLALSVFLEHWLILVGVIAWQIYFVFMSCVVFGPDAISPHLDL